MSNQRVTSLTPEYPVLGMLIEQTGHGYALHAKLRTELGELWNISLSQTYNILKRLETQSLVAGSPRPQQEKPDRYEIRLTATGRNHFNKWLQQPTNPSSQALRVEFLTRLYFARRHQPELLLSLVDQQSRRIEEALGELNQRLEHLVDTSQINRWALQLRILHIEGFLAWLEDNRANITQPANFRKGQL